MLETLYHGGVSYFDGLFLNVFALFYMLAFPLFKNPVLTSYVAILVMVLGFAWLNYRWIRRNKARAGKWRYVGALALEAYLVVFLIWYIFTYFHTYRLVS